MVLTIKSKTPLDLNHIEVMVDKIKMKYAIKVCSICDSSLFDEQSICNSCEDTEPQRVNEKHTYIVTDKKLELEDAEGLYTL